VERATGGELAQGGGSTERLSSLYTKRPRVFKRDELQNLGISASRNVNSSIREAALFNPFNKRPSQSHVHSLDDVDLDLETIPGALGTYEGIPRVNWDVVREAVKTYQDHPALNQIWTELAAQWLGLLGRSLNPIYKLYEGRHLLMLTAARPERVRLLLDTGDAAYERLQNLVRRTTAQRGNGKHAVIVMAVAAHYYAYLSYYHPEQDKPIAMSGGTFLSHGYRHTVIDGQRNTDYRTLVHELAHDSVSHLTLPLWLDEGIAQSVEDMVPDYRPPFIDGRQARLHRRYWSWFGLDHFWTGKSFHAVSSQRLSYQLADILFRNLRNDRKRGKRLGDFVTTATRDDVGAAACQQCFGCSLSDLAAEFLGPGDWNPARDAVRSGPNADSAGCAAPR
jgi:hypothetical protein